MLVIVPVYKDAPRTRQALGSFGDPVLVIDNNADQEVKEVISKYNRIVNPENIYVNPAWNKGMEFFLKGGWDLLAIASSDVVMPDKWRDVVETCYEPGEVYVPTIVPHLQILEPAVAEKKEVEGNVPGFFFILSRAAVELIYLIPEEIKVWFGDEYIFTKLKKAGYKIMQLTGVECHHFQSSSWDEETPKIIEEDKRAWKKLNA